MARKPRGFTLIELLVVVSIIALLIAILLPALGRARDQVKTIACQANMRQVGIGVRLFAASNDNRAPGGGYYNTGSQAWQDVFTKVVFDNRIAILRDWGPTAPPAGVPRGQLTCTNMVAWSPAGGGAIYPRPWNCNNNLLGGNRDSSGVLQYGVDLTVTDGIPAGFNDGNSHNQHPYYLGTKLSRFAPESGKIVMLENERSSDTYTGSSSTGKVLVGADPSFPPWAGPGGRPAFRHNMMTRGNFLFVDAHVEALKPSDNCDSPSLYSVSN